MLKTENILNKLKEKELQSDFWDFRENDTREHVHSLIRYPAVMVPNMQKEIFNIILSESEDIKSVLDPFMGSGTVLIEGQLKGLQSIGIDINPLAVLASKVKLNRYSEFTLKQKLNQIRTHMENSEVDIFTFGNIEKWYSMNAILQLSKIRSAICSLSQVKYRQFFWVCFAEIAKQADNSRTSTFKLHIKIDEDIKKNANFNVIDRFYDKAMQNIVSVVKYNEIERDGKAPCKIYYGDSIKILNSRKLKRDSLDLIISSPPYGDNATTITYGQYSVLPLRWIVLSDIDNKIDKDVISTLG